ncbi:DsbA family protein [Hymenobacter sp. BT730]|uniref:DsbA family protein n=1 Tax=Hymenobacter sp. BT730 TaxID=3063332 RepID=UPI0026E053DF|nr:DsbA family protein [Hymenobacter sp. BT730]
MEQNIPDLPELLYLYDPLCGWCFGTTPVIKQIEQDFEGRLQVSVLSGGMITGEQVGPIGEDWPSIQVAARQIEKATGVVFGEAFWQVGEAGARLQDSEPPIRALSVFRQLAPTQRPIDFAQALQQAWFQEGQDMNHADTYARLALEFGLDEAEFIRRFQDPQTAQATRQEFAAIARMGIQGFPTMLLRVGSQGYVLARGYQPYAVLAEGVEQALQQAAEEAGQE